MLDASCVYMDIYLPTAAGRPRPDRVGRPHRPRRPIPAHVIPARVVFVASQAQFTPKNRRDHALSATS